MYKNPVSKFQRATIVIKSRKTFEEGEVMTFLTFFGITDILCSF